MEGDPALFRLPISFPNFYPRPPDGGRSHFSPWKIGYECISIHALWVEGDVLKAVIRITVCISIHALRVEGDANMAGTEKTRGYFYPRPPGGGRQQIRDMYDRGIKFLSTPSGWRATDVAIDDRHCARISIHALRVEGDLASGRSSCLDLDFYPRPPGGGRHFFGFRFAVALEISIHALRVEGDQSNRTTTQTKIQFLSTPSGWRATVLLVMLIAISIIISIHALRVEGDNACVWARFKPFYFYPRPPGGGRPHVRLSLRQLLTFLSTPSGWRATGVAGCDSQCGPISIHALRVEGDILFCSHSVERSISIHALRVEGDIRHSIPSKSMTISIHALRVEGDLVCSRSPLPRRDFYPRPPGGGRRIMQQRGRAPCDFYPRPPGGGRQQKRTKFSSVFAQKGEEFASLRRGKRKFAGGVLKRTNFGF